MTESMTSQWSDPYQSNDKTDGDDYSINNNSSPYSGENNHINLLHHTNDSSNLLKYNKLRRNVSYNDASSYAITNTLIPRVIRSESSTVDSVNHTRDHTNNQFDSSTVLPILAVRNLSSSGELIDDLHDLSNNQHNSTANKQNNTIYHNTWSANHLSSPLTVQRISSTGSARLNTLSPDALDLNSTSNNANNHHGKLSLSGMPNIIRHTSSQSTIGTHTPAYHEYKQQQQQQQIDSQQVNHITNTMNNININQNQNKSINSSARPSYDSSIHGRSYPDTLPSTSTHPPTSTSPLQHHDNNTLPVSIDNATAHNYVYMYLPDGRIQAIQLPPHLLHQLQQQQQLQQNQAAPPRSVYNNQHQNVPCNNNMNKSQYNMNKSNNRSTQSLSPYSTYDTHSSQHTTQPPYSSPIQSPNTLDSFNWTTSTAQTPTLQNAARVPPQQYMESLSGTGSDSIVQLAKTQVGSRMIQSKLTGHNIDMQYFNTVFAQLYCIVPELMTDLFGNYLIQRIIELCNQQQHTAIVQCILNDIVSISCDRQGTRSIQKLIHTCTDKATQQLIIDSLSGMITIKGRQQPKLLYMVRDPHASHVISIILDEFTSDTQLVQPIISCMIKCVRMIGNDQFGLCIVKKCLLLCSVDELQSVTHTIIQHIMEYINHMYGNYLIQHVIDICVQRESNTLLCLLHDTLLSNYSQLSKQKYSSNVIEKMLRVELYHIRNDIITELCSTPSDLIELLQCSYGNYVIQNILSISTPQQTQYVLQSINHQAILDSLRKPIKQKWLYMIHSQTQSNTTKYCYC